MGIDVGGGSTIVIAEYARILCQAEIKVCLDVSGIRLFGSSCMGKSIQVTIRD